MNEKLTHEWRLAQDEQDRIGEWAKMARHHPTWSVAYAEDVPKLLIEIARLRTELGWIRGSNEG